MCEIVNSGSSGFQLRGDEVNIKEEEEEEERDRERESSVWVKEGKPHPSSPLFSKGLTLSDDWTAKGGQRLSA